MNARAVNEMVHFRKRGYLCGEDSHSEEDSYMDSNKNRTRKACEDEPHSAVLKRVSFIAVQQKQSSSRGVMRRSKTENEERVSKTENEERVGLGGGGGGEEGGEEGGGGEGGEEEGGGGERARVGGEKRVREREREREAEAVESKRKQAPICEINGFSQTDVCKEYGYLQAVVRDCQLWCLKVNQLIKPTCSSICEGYASSRALSLVELGQLEGLLAIAPECIKTTEYNALDLLVKRANRLERQLKKFFGVQEQEQGQEEEGAQGIIPDDVQEDRVATGYEDLEVHEPLSISKSSSSVSNRSSSNRSYTNDTSESKSGKPLLMSGEPLLVRTTKDDCSPLKQQPYKQPYSAELTVRTVRVATTHLHDSAGAPFRNETPLQRNETPLQRDGTPLQRNETPLQRKQKVPPLWDDFLSLLKEAACVYPVKITHVSRLLAIYNEACNWANCHVNKVKKGKYVFGEYPEYPAYSIADHM